VAGFRPGFGRGGMTHSFLVIIEVGVGRLGAAAIEVMVGALDDLMARVGRAGARGKGGGEPAFEGVDTAGDAILAEVA
jgi:hypothetical protein